MKIINILKRIFSDKQIITSYKVCYELSTIEGNKVLEDDIKIDCYYLDESDYISQIRNKLEERFKSHHDNEALKYLQKFRKVKTINNKKETVITGKDLRKVRWCIYDVRTRPLTLEEFERLKTEVFPII